MKKVCFISIIGIISGVIDFYLEHTKYKGIIPQEELEARDTGSLQEVVAKVKETYVDLSKAFIGHASFKKAIFDKTCAEIVVDAYHKIQYKKRQNEFDRPSFWNILF